MSGGRGYIDVEVRIADDWYPGRLDPDSWRIVPGGSRQAMIHYTITPSGRSAEDRVAEFNQDDIRYL